MLISRDKSKLESVASELELAAKQRSKNIRTRCIELDFTKTYDANTFRQVFESQLKELDIGVLVNNVGLAWVNGEEHPSYFFDGEPEKIHDVMACNMYGAVLLTSEIVSGLKRRFSETGKRSCITFTSSMAALAPVPSVGLYSATKIYTDFLTHGLIYELAKYKVDVCSWRAAAVATKLIGNPEPMPGMPTPEQFVQAAFSKMTSGLHAGFFPHEIVHLVWTNLNDVLPLGVCQSFFHKLYQSHDKKEKGAGRAKQA